MSNTQKLSEIIIDIEAQNETNENVRGILRRPDDNLVDQAKVEICLMRCCMALFIIIVMAPMAIADLYFGFTDSTCSKEEPDELSISIKLYLLVSGFMSLAVMTLFLIGINFIGQTDKIDNLKCCFMCCGSVGVILTAIFSLIWNILGAIVFWGYIYGNGNCNKTFSTYVFVSLIIKLIATLLGMASNKKEDKK